MSMRKFDVYNPETEEWKHDLTIIQLKKLDIFTVSGNSWFVAETDPFDDNPTNPQNPRYAIRAKDYDNLDEAKNGRIVAVLFGD